MGTHSGAFGGGHRHPEEGFLSPVEGRPGTGNVCVTNGILTIGSAEGACNRMGDGFR